MPESPRTDYSGIFSTRLAQIDKLETTPNLMRQHAIDTLNRVLDHRAVINNRQAIQTLENGRDSLENISDLSMASNYKVIYSQMCILMVSDVEAVLKLYFENAANSYQQLRRDNPKLQQVKVTLEDIIANGLRFGGKVGKLIIEKDKPNFQDLKSIKDVFNRYFGKEISLDDETEKRVIFYLEARHILVHKGGIADDKFVSATNRMGANLKDLGVGDVIEFSHEDWAQMKDCFTKLIQSVTSRA